jgi:hypothetical protein
MIPSFIICSMARPPEPTAWNTIVCSPAASSTSTAFIAPSVVMPTVVTATRVVPPVSISTPVEAMPQTAPAAFARIFRVTGFRPMMSATENIIVMSRMSTQGATFPEAIVETITLGNP